MSRWKFWKKLAVIVLLLFAAIILGVVVVSTVEFQYLERFNEGMEEIRTVSLVIQILVVFVVWWQFPRFISSVSANAHKRAVLLEQRNWICGLVAMLLIVLLL
ncbi:hypothetical protein AB9X29_003740 [Vibrio vulnificus]